MNPIYWNAKNKLIFLFIGVCLLISAQIAGADETADKYMEYKQQSEEVEYKEDKEIFVKEGRGYRGLNDLGKGFSRNFLFMKTFAISKPSQFETENQVKRGY